MLPFFWILMKYFRISREGSFFSHKFPQNGLILNKHIYTFLEVIKLNVKKNVTLLTLFMNEASFPK